MKFQLIISCLLQNLVMTAIKFTFYLFTEMDVRFFWYCWKMYINKPTINSLRIVCNQMQRCLKISHPYISNTEIFWFFSILVDVIPYVLHQNFWALPFKSAGAECIFPMILSSDYPVKLKLFYIILSIFFKHWS